MSDYPPKQLHVTAKANLSISSVLVNNAGYLEACVPIRESKPEDWMRTQRINIEATYLATRAFLRSAASKGWLNSASDKKGKLCVINTSSVGSAGTRPGFSSYQPFVSSSNSPEGNALTSSFHSGKSQINRFTEFLHFEEPAVRTFAMHPCARLSLVFLPPWN